MPHYVRVAVRRKGSFRKNGGADPQTAEWSGPLQFEILPMVHSCGFSRAQ